MPFESLEGKQITSHNMVENIIFCVILRAVPFAGVWKYVIHVRILIHFECHEIDIISHRWNLHKLTHTRRVIRFSSLHITLKGLQKKTTKKPIFFHHLIFFVRSTSLKGVFYCHFYYFNSHTHNPTVSNIIFHII